MGNNRSSKIYMDTNKLIRIANQMGQTASNISDTANRVNGISTSVEQAWNSEYTSTYLEETLKVKRNIQKIAVGTDKLSQKIYEIAQDIRATEEKNRMIFSANRR
ncbi:MAG: hypothetical protein RSD63_07990 [Eubacterium sp.]